MKKTTQQGASLIIVLVILTVLLLGALSLARLNETNALIAGNIAFKDAGLQASEVGVSEAFIAITSLINDEQDQPNWYFATLQGDDASGIPKTVDWTLAPSVQVGAFDVRYVVERQCSGVVPVQDINAQCVIKRIPTTASAKASFESLETAASKQFRITVYVQGPKNTKTFVQSLVVR